MEPVRIMSSNLEVIELEPRRLQLDSFQNVFLEISFLGLFDNYSSLPFR